MSTFFYDPHKLNNVIGRLKSEPIKKQASIVRDTLISLDTNDNPDYVVKLLHLTHTLLTSKPGDERTYQLERYCEQAEIAQGMPSPFWQTVGLAMMLLGACVAAIGICCVMPGVGMAVGVATLLTGFGIFNYGHYQTGLSNDMQQLSNLVEKSEDILFKKA